jgi:hypothetical protein
LTASTFSGNSAPGGGIVTDENSIIYLVGTLLDTGASGNNCVNNLGIISDNGYNLSDDESCPFLPANHSKNSATLNLEALAYNDGGTTQTHRPGTGSDAIGAIPYGTTIIYAEYTPGLQRLLHRPERHQPPARERGPLYQRCG